MTIRKKRGKLDASEKAFIRGKFKEMSPAEIGKTLNRHADVIQDFIKTIEEGKDQDYTFEQSKMAVSLEDQIKSRYYWPTVKKQLVDKAEQDFFIASWCEIVEQFRGDILPTEEQQIKELILSEIYKNRAGEAKVRELKKIEEVEAQIMKIMKLPLAVRNSDELTLLETQLGYSKTAAQQYSAELEKYSKITKDLNKDLKGTRDQRFSKVESGNKTFQAIIKDLMEDSNRDKEGREAELMKIAIDKETKRLYEPHQYQDGGVDSPIYNVDSVEYNKGKDEEDE